MAVNKKNGSKNKRKKTNYIIQIVLCVIALSAITFSLFLLVRYYQLRQTAEALQARIDVYTDPEDPYLSRSEADALISEAELKAYDEGVATGQNDLLASIKAQLIESDSTMDTIKEMYPDELIVVDHDEILFYPILDSLKHHAYADEDFYLDSDGRIKYHGKEASTETWIDVSRFQEKINWSKVADDGIDAAIIRLGYRGYSKGDIMDDDTYEYNIDGALDNGLKVGVYFLTQATSDSEAEEEAEYVLDHIRGYRLDCPIVLDVELVGGDDGRGNALSMEERTQYAITFLERIEAAGYDTCIYGNLKTFLLMLDMEKLEDRSKWFAGYTETPYFPYAMDMWQYTDTGRVDGISGDVDINIRFVTGE